MFTRQSRILPGLLAQLFSDRPVRSKNPPRWDVALEHVVVSKNVTGDENRHEFARFPTGESLYLNLMDRYLIVSRAFSLLRLRSGDRRR